MPNLKIDLDSKNDESTDLPSPNPHLEQPRPRFNSAGSKLDTGYNLKAVNPMSFAIPTMIVKAKSPKMATRQSTLLDPCIEESYGGGAGAKGDASSSKQSSSYNVPHSGSHLSYGVDSNNTDRIDTSTV